MKVVGLFVTEDARRRLHDIRCRFPFMGGWIPTTNGMLWVGPDQPDDVKLAARDPLFFVRRGKHATVLEVFADRQKERDLPSSS